MLGALLFFPMFALRGMGAGDVKLLAAVGAWLGTGAGRVRRAGHEHRRRRHRAGGRARSRISQDRVPNLWMLLTHWRVMGIGPLHEVTLQGARGPRLAYAIPIAIGTLVTLWLQ